MSIHESLDEAIPKQSGSYGKLILLALMLLAVLLSACGGQPVATPTAIANPTNTALPPTPTTAPPTNTAEPTVAFLSPVETVKHFLDAIYQTNKPDEDSARSYLSEALLDQLGGKSVVALLDLPEAPLSYTVQPGLGPEIGIPENSYVTATLDYDPDPVQVDFLLQLSAAGTWRISQITVQKPAGESEAALTRFLDALFGLNTFSRPDEQTARTLLSQDLLIQLGDNSVLTLLGVQTAPPAYTIQPIIPDASIPENAYYSVTLNYAEAPQTITFVLSMLTGSWQITHIEPQ